MSVRRAVVLAAALLVSAFAAFPGRTAAATTVKDESASIWPRQDYAGDLLGRRYLTGDWGGWRTRLAAHGVTLNVDLLQSYRGVVDGGRDENDAYGGSADYELHVETERLGLWPGGFLRIFAESRFGDFVNLDAGSLVPADTDGVFPLPEDISTLTSVSYIQFLAPWVAVLGGKLDTLDGDQNAFASGRGKTQFSNLAFVLNPALFRSVPYSALGGGVLFVLPDELGTLQVLALDAGGRPDVSGFEDAFDKGTVVAEELRVGYRPLGLPGHVTLGGSWSSRNFAVLDQDRRLVVDALIDRRFGTDFADVERAGDGWAIYYNFDQFLWVEKDDPTQGVGLFFRFAQADERTNPIERFYSFGFGGKGIVPTRDADTFG
ncbi:MAG: carbohydrate porin, partial [Deltaproteobacteria bacterium]|nr:carbohydrate porin [Deltaproteobacteria bacterium]